MRDAYFIVLAACALAAAALIALRLLELGRNPRPGWGRLLNEWIWTALPVAVFLALLWRGMLHH